MPGGTPQRSVTERRARVAEYSYNAGTFRGSGQVGGTKCSTQQSTHQCPGCRQRGETGAETARFYNIRAAAVACIFARHRILQS
jgi:hypothetical protein